ncbi:MAG: Uma2 family endonuclease [Armatimonadetes bacterium]|nr:Uma2 family endonuclease [Armatimonadota bacterium]
MSDPERVPLLTAEEFAALPDNGTRQELIEGRVVEMPPAFFGHGLVCSRIHAPVATWVEAHGLGYCACNDPGLILSREPDTVRAPDISYYAAERLPEPGAKHYFDFPPDLVVEVVSEDDRQRDVLAKVSQWLAAGVKVVVVAWPKIERLTVFGPDEETAILGRGDTLTFGSLLPGFALPVDRIFG